MSTSRSIASLTAKSSTYLTRTKWFQKLCKWAFVVIDHDKSGTIGKDEMYTGVLLIHLNLAKYAGYSACRPPTRKVVEGIFDKMDDNKSGQIDESEFIEIMVVICSHIATRIALQYFLIFLIVPQIAWFMTKGLSIATYSNARLSTVVSFFQFLIDSFPSFMKDTLESIPGTLISSLLVFAAIPACLDFIDDYMGHVAANTTMLAEAELDEAKES